MHRMSAKHLLMLFLVAFASRGQCFKNGFSKDTCDSLIPNQEQGEPNVTIANSAVPYKIVTKSTHYRRNRDFEIEIKGENIEGFQLQIRNYESGHGIKPHRIGVFVDWPKESKPLQCDDGKNTSVTHTNLDLKNNLKFKWRAPSKDEGKLKLYYAFVSADGVYWTDAYEELLDFAELPLSVDNCGENKGCFRYSANKDECDGNTCLYLMTYEKIDQKVEFSLGALTEDSNSYTAVGFRETEDGEIDFTVCIKEDSQVSVKNYVLLAKGKSPEEKTVNLENIGTDKEEGNFWCEFTRPIKDAGAKPLDFEKELYWIFTWGKMNKTSHKPIFGDEHWYKSKHSIEKAIDNKMYTDSSNSITVTGFMLLSSFFLLFSQI